MRPSRPRSRAIPSRRARSGPSLTTTTAQRRIESGRLEQEVDPFRPIEPARRRARSPRSRRSGTRAPAAGAGAPRRPARSSARAGRPRSARSRRDAWPRRAPPGPDVAPRAGARGPPVTRRIARDRSVELVRLPELVDQPHALLRVTKDVRRELRRDHHVDGPAVRLVEIEHAPQKRLCQHRGARIPLEGDRDEVGLVPPRAQLARRARRS